MKYFLIALAFAAVFVPHAQGQRPLTKPDELDKPIARELTGGQSHTYRLALTEGQYLNLTVEQHGIDVAVALYGTEANKIFDIDLFASVTGYEPVFYKAEKTGDYRVEVYSPAGPNAAGKYKITSKISATTTAADTDRQAALELLLAADKLEAASAPEAKQQALAKYEEAIARWQRAGDTYWEAATLSRIGSTLHNLREYQKAAEIHRQALLLRRAINDRRGEAVSLLNIGVSHFELGANQQALEFYNQALPMVREVGDRVLEALVLNNLGAAYDKLGETTKALEFYRQALQLRQATGHRYAAADTLNNMAIVYKKSGEQQNAIDAYQQALKVYQELADANGQANALFNTAVVYESMRNLAEAEKYYAQSVPLYRAAGNRTAEGNALNNIGNTYFNRNQKPKALKYFQQALPLFAEDANKANTLRNLGIYYQQFAKDFGKALEYYRQSLGLYQQLADRAGQAKLHYDMALTYEAAKQLAESVNSYTEAISHYRAVQDRTGEANALNNIGNTYFNRNQKPAALKYFQQALPLYAQEDDNKANTLGNMGNCYRDIGEPEKALERYNQALAIYKKTGNRGGEGTQLFSVGTIYHLYLDERQKSLPYYEQALPLLRAGGIKINEGKTHLNLGIVYGELSDLQKAIDNQEAAVAIFRELEDPGNEASALQNLANVYNRLEQYEKSLAVLHQALSIWRRIGAPVGEMRSLNSIGSAYKNPGDYQKAFECFQQSLAIARAGGYRGDEATVLISLGSNYEKRGDQPKALELYQAALSLARSIDYRSSQAAALFNIGDVLREQGDADKALPHFQEALAIRKSLGNLSGEADVLYHLAMLERDRNNLAEARTNIEAALKIVETLRARYTNQDLRAGYFATVQSYYKFYVDLLMRLHQQEPAKSYDVLALQADERSRARLLLEMLAEAGANIREGANPALLEHERGLREQLNAKAQQQMKLLADQHTAEQAREMAQKIEDLTAELQRVETQIRQTSPRYAALTQPQPLTLREIQTQVVDADTLLLQYSLGESRSYLWAVTPSSVTSYELPKRAEIEEAARQFYDLLTDATAWAASAQRGLVVKSLQNSPGSSPEVATRLSRMLLAQVAAQLGKKRLLIVGDGALQFISFGALPIPVRTTPAAAAYQPLIMEHEIVTLPSASTLSVLRRELQNRQPAEKTVAVMADPVFEKNDERIQSSLQRSQGDARETAVGGNSPRGLSVQLIKSAAESGVAPSGLMIPRLPGTKVEAEQILSLFPAASRKQAFGFAANRATATGAELSHYRYVHFATHGFLNSQHPELSGLVLTMFNEQGQPQDGFLRAHEIFNLKLPADLVVLSACQTGLGKEIRGEGLVGMTRGFMYAGTPRVVVSLWSVSDEATAELMARFYRGIVIGKLRPAKALQAAQISLLKEPRFNAPYFWAAFTLQGEWQ